MMAQMMRSTSSSRSGSTEEVNAGGGAGSNSILGWDGSMVSRVNGRLRHNVKKEKK